MYATRICKERFLNRFPKSPAERALAEKEAAAWRDAEERE